ncbi:MAG TPA: S-layer homology domain-containing protein [Terriglobia bacterium]|nr:S-layer homology domain-containing protein [Terriglobia bacterium]
MNTFLIGLLLMQSSLLLPPRTAIENPAVVSAVPAKLQKDYVKLWTRFLAGSADTKLTKDLDNLVKKQKNFDAALTIQAYIELYKGNDAAAIQKFQQALGMNANNRIALYYLGELAYTHQDYVRANTFYSLLLSIDKNRTDIEPKRQKALLLATDSLLRSAARAQAENRLSEAEEFYKQALAMAPREPAVHTLLADLLAKENKIDEAAAERKAAEELTPRRGTSARNNPEPKPDNLEDLGRWGNDIGVFREIRNAQSVTREQVAVVIVKYFPQVVERQQTPQIVTDIETSWARTEIQTVVDVGLMDVFANHTFEPSAPTTRGEFAAALARLIGLLGLPPSPAPPTSTPDVVSTNAQYADIQLVLGYALMRLQDSGEFGVSGNLSGAEAVRAAEQLLRTFQQAQH